MAELAQDRPAWRTAARKGSKLFKEDRLQKLDARDWQERTECLTPALLYPVSTAERYAHPPLGYNPTCAFINTDESSSDTKDYYYMFMNMCIAYIKGGLYRNKERKTNE